MSSSSNPPSMTSSSSPSGSASGSARGGVEIPASTLIAIGLGFVAFTLVLLFVSVFVRLIRVQRRLNVSRSDGPRITFRQAWEREGGLFGFMSRGSDSHLFAGQAAARLADLRRRQQEMWVTLTQEKVRPIMWEVPVEEKGRAANDTGAIDAPDCRPFALFSSTPPRYADRAKAPDELPKPCLVMSLLITMPSEAVETMPGRTQSRRISEFSDNEEEWPDLPELVLGTTEVWPMYEAKEQDREEDAVSIMSREDPGKKGGKSGKALGEVQQLEYGTSGSRRARWTKFGPAGWQIEGLG